MPAANIFFALLVAGLLGMMGQGVRVVVGLKKLNDDAATHGVSSADLFMAARLFVSLMIGFIAGIAAALALTRGNIFAIGAGDINILLGIAAAGYAGTDFIEAFAPTITSKAPPILPGGSPQTAAQLTPAPIVVTVAPAPPVPASPVNPKYGVAFGSLVPGGFFSADPDDLNVHRSIRTNNPGALNFSSWQKSRLGYVGITQPDNSPDHNVTTIYRTPEHGVERGTTCSLCSITFRPEPSP